MKKDIAEWRPAAEYKTKPGKWWVGRRVRLMRDIRTNFGEAIRKGRLAEVARKFGGLTLIGSNGLHLTRVGYWELDVDITPRL